MGKMAVAILTIFTHKKFSMKFGELKRIARRLDISHLFLLLKVWMEKVLIILIIKALVTTDLHLGVWAGRPRSARLSKFQDTRAEKTTDRLEQFIGQDRKLPLASGTAQCVPHQVKSRLSCLSLRILKPLTSVRNWSSFSEPFLLD